MTAAVRVMTIGHSNHDDERFLSLLREHGVTAVADVRSSPYSQFSPQFNRERLRSFLTDHGIGYAFLGRELGARSPDPSCYVGGKVQYALIAQTVPFQEGLARVIAGARNEQVVLMCTERDPLDCHRTILIARQLVELGVEVDHIHGDGRLEPHHDAMARLLDRFGLQDELFRSHEELVDDALCQQEHRIAYVDAELAAAAREGASS